MNLSKIDLLNKKFTKRPLGYAPAEVDQFLVEVAEALGQAADHRKNMIRKIKHLEGSIKEYRNRDQTLRDTLMSTQKMVDDLKVAAGREAELILEEANSKAESAVQVMQSRLAQLAEEIESLKRQRTQFKIQVRALVNSHLQLIESEDPEQERFEAMESKLKYLKKVE